MGVLNYIRQLQEQAARVAYYRPRRSHFTGEGYLQCECNGEQFADDSLAKLRDKVREYITWNCFGAPDVGSIFEVRKNRELVAQILFNGRINVLKLNPILEI
ncbi:MAG: hypothetical protein OSA92_10070 [Pirellulaceae bacterium]|nr:hypothetical protein [Pirellulaceae bacterium]